MSLDLGLADKTVIITGAGRGIGRALAVKLAGYGAKVYGISNNDSELLSLKTDCPSVETITVDLADWNATRSAVQGIGPVDALVNNAAILFGDGFFNITEESFDKTMNVNVKAVINVSQIVASSMMEAGKKGSIVNISTVASMRAFPNASAHSVSKAALDLLTKLMACELGPKGIRVNAVNLGSVPTDMLTTWLTDLVTYSGKSMEDIQSEFLQRVPLRKTIVEMDDAINTIVFAMSELSGTTTGANFIVDGGFCVT